MTLWTRAATLVALTCTMTGLLATSTPGLAAEIVGVSATPTVAVPVAFDNDPIAPTVPALPTGDVTSASDTPEYASLDAAVAAQGETADNEALRCLAGAVYYEAKGEPLTGQLAVAEVVLNRAKSGRFPTDVCGVVLQRGQFGFVRDGAIPAIDATRASWKRAVAVAKVALADMWDSPASEALYFNAVRRAPGRAIRVASIGNHVFYR